MAKHNYDPLGASALNIAMHLLNHLRESGVVTREYQDNLLEATILNYASHDGPAAEFARGSMLNAQSADGRQQTQEHLERQRPQEDGEG